jgi:chromosome segregation ATPase
MKRKYSLIAAITLLSTLGTQAFAQSQDSVAKAQYMLRQLNAEKVALEKENAELKRKLQEMEQKGAEETAQAGRQNKNQSSRIRELESARTGLEQELRQAMLHNSQYGDTLKLCLDNNRKLYEVNLELLGKYEDKGLWKIITQAEPLTRISRVELENMVQDFQYRIEDLKLEAAQNDGRVPLPEQQSLTTGAVEDNSVSAVP